MQLICRTFAFLVIASAISGCASNSNKHDTSPCACEFTPLNITSVGVGHA